MVSRIIFFSIFIAVLVLLEWYVFNGIKVAMRPGWPQRTAKLVQLFSILVTVGGVLGTVLTLSKGLSSPGWFANVLLGLTVTFFFTKVVFAAVLLMEDTYRVGRFGVEKISALLSSDTPEVSFESRRKFIAQLGLVVAAVPFTSYLYGFLKGRYDFKVHRLTLTFPDLPDAFDGFRLAQLSDVHAGSFDSYSAVKGGLELLQKENPDAILFTGDMVNNFAFEVEPYMDLLGGLHAPMGKFAVMGNHDYGDYARWSSPAEKHQNLDQLKAYHAEMGFKLLDNAAVQLERGDSSIVIAGVENWGLPPFPQYGDLDEAVAGLPQDAFTILMSHDPTHWEAQVLPHRKKVHLTLSGHTHGAQMGVEIPGFSWSPAGFRYKRWAGAFEENGQHLYINRGFGYIGYPGRIGIWPEITIIELRKA